MKASFFNQPGDADVLEYGDFPLPEVGKGEVLIKVKACGVNRLDIWQRIGKYPVNLPHILGSDIAGVTTGGQAVVVNPAIDCEECPRCKAGLACEFVKILGFSRNGGYAEFVAVPAKNVHPKPEGLSFTEAAAFPLTFLTAWHMLKTRARLCAGESVFIWGATGGLGVAAIKIAKYLGARVIAATRDRSKMAALNKLGADEVYFVGEKMGFGLVDVVFESVGEATWNESISFLKPFGRMVLAGTTSGKKAELDLQLLYGKQLEILGARMGSKKEFEEVLTLVDRGVLMPEVSKVFDLKEAAGAHRALERGEFIGKIVLRNL